MGIVHHSNYIRYFECGRHQFLLDVGLPITELEKSGIMMPVVSVEAHYHTPARMGDILRVVSRVEKERRSGLRRHSGPRLHSQRHPPSYPHPCRAFGCLPEGRSGSRPGSVGRLSDKAAYCSIPENIPRNIGKCRLICMSMIFRCLQIGLHFSPLCKTPKNALGFASIL